MMEPILYSNDDEWITRVCNIMIVWDETCGNSIIYSNDEEWNTRECNIVIVWDETRWNQFYVVIMLNESQWKCNIVIVWDETWWNSFIYSNDEGWITRQIQYICCGMNRNGNAIYWLHGMKHDGIQLYIVMMWIESQGKFNVVIVWDETWGN